MQYAKPKSIMEQLAPFFIQTGIGVLLLLVMWQIIIRLPMLAEIYFPLDFSIYDLLTAVFLTIIAYLFFHLGATIEVRMNYVDTRFIQSGTIVKQVIFLIVLSIVYVAYRPLIVPYLAEFAWVYHSLFLVLFLCLFAMLGMAIYRNSEALTEITLNASQNTKASPSRGIVVCKQCAQKNPPGTAFCGFCGAVFKVEQQCSKCGAIIKEGSRFCNKCGAHAEESFVASPQQNSGVLQCSKCGAAVKPGVKFCNSCGNKIEEISTMPKQSLANQCVQCSSNLKPGAKFCPTCGAKSEVATIPETPQCFSCQAKLKLGAKFCPFCGSIQSSL